MEVVHKDYPKGPFITAIFDFDGTISLLRRGWKEVMVTMATESLVATQTDEPPEQLEAIAEEFITRLTGEQTIYQMIELEKELRLRGAPERDPLAHKQVFLRKLDQLIVERKQALASGEAKADEWLVAGAVLLLDRLVSAGVTCHLISGTDVDAVREEATLLGIAKYFTGSIQGALEDYKSFSKAQSFKKIVQQVKEGGASMLVLGDGPVEIREARQQNALAIGIASNEFTRTGYDESKRSVLRSAGAQILLPDLREALSLIQPTTEGCGVFVSVTT